MPRLVPSPAPASALLSISIDRSLLCAVTSHSDWYPTRETAGKVVWCELAAGPPGPSEDAGSAPQGLLPRRVRREQEKRPVETMSDPDVLRRVRDRLREQAGLA